ncbi:toll/interleukin-1 receptor domain-containing protein [Actinosynnema pretiosum subsp. pretiosum]|uniref:Toll/interleukin-1 receptor domain-containing protein n=1 Tax=Actinosynnema pretiosum subsp. pretiosum TaxID=103721 RepID=A0AA45LBT5_9PSEU|nr:hypothetical protein APASM_1649 [Actinosynnema pretiosum subsp. pretiosum]QUF06698.1 toll/interleukin-1 receptor domain-containing protein [Actinosynnema pretiosum subsp. pretiosum]
MYEYDVLISYCRDGAAVPAWVANHLRPALVESLADQSLGEVGFYCEPPDAAEGGFEQSFRALRRSKVLLAVCSPKYFYDERCLAQWHSMCDREKAAGMPPSSLTCPVVFCDSKNFPSFAKSVDMHDLKRWNLTTPQFKETRAYQGFGDAVNEIALELVEKIARAPRWSPDWPVNTPTAPEPTPSQIPRY